MVGFFWWRRTPSEGARLLVRRARLPLVTCTALALAAAWRAQPAIPDEAAPPPTLTRVEQLRALSPEDAKRGGEIHLRAVVTYADPVGPNLFVQDATGGVWVDLRGISGSLQPGERVDLRGTVGSGFAPYVTNPRWTVLGRVPMPIPRRVTYAQMATGGEDGEWVEIEGVIRRFALEAEGDILVIDVSAEGHQFRARIPGFHHPLPVELSGARVAVRGVSGAAFNTKNQLVSVHLFVPTLDEIRVLEPVPKDLFALPVLPIERVARFSPGRSEAHRVRLHGAVTLQIPGERLFIRDRTAAIEVESDDGGIVEPGRQVDVVGFPRLGGFTPVLEAARFRPAEPGPPPAPIRVTGPEALKGLHAADLVEIDGEIQDDTPDATGRALLLKSGNIVFDAHLRAPEPARGAGSVATGSRVRLVGICSIRIDENGSPAAFRILLRRADDVRVLAPPSRWTPRRALAALGVVALVALSALAWVAILRRRVRDQTTIIRKRLEREAALEQRYQDLFERNLVGVYRADLDGRVLECNVACARIFGYETAAELVGQPLWKTPAERGRREELIASLRAEKRLTNVETCVSRPSGPTAWLLENLGLAEGRSGEPPAIEGTVVDITERKEAEEALRHSEERFESVFRGSPLAIGISEMAEGRIIDVNEQYERLFGYAPGEMIGRSTLELGLWADVGDRDRALDELRAGRVVRNHEVRLRCKSGEIRHALLSMERLDFSAAEPALVIVAADITDQKNLEEQLRQSQKMEAVGRLAGGVAHDFNNLLGVITGYGELLQRDIGPGHPGFRRVEEIRKAADRATTLTRQLLAFSRKQVLEPKVLDINAVVSDTVKMLHRLIGEDIQLITVFAEGLGRVKADPGQVEQVIVNLAVNARDAMTAGGKLIIETGNVNLDVAYARSRPDARAGPHVRLAFSDTGHGMDAETLSHMFEPFFTTKEQGKGTGLGLATVHGIIRQSGGHVTVYSEPGLGTTFKVYLPRLEEEQEAVASPALVEVAPSGTETILVAEDDSSFRVMVGEILESAGYEVLEGPTPEEALAAAGAHGGPIPLILTDVVMPRMSGRQLADALRSSRPEARVLFMSGYTDDAIGQHGILEPGVHFLQKPFTADRLLRKVREVLNGPAPVKVNELG
jgi:two-component system, cell cycle sensor histidine kinase and response regulator CckA